ncbi:MAG: thiamine-phosphate kinase [Pseudomonadota bacterium]
MNEFELIRTFFSGDDASARIGVGDDAAILDVPAGAQLAVAVDTVIEDVHFPAASPADAIGHRALAVNLSDLAAMGARPKWFTLALTLPDLNEAWLHEFSDGLLTLARRFSVDLVGGDTTRGPLSVTVQAMGFCEQAPIARSGANVGDSIFVSGPLGDAAAGLLEFSAEPQSAKRSDRLLRRFLYPEPRVDLGIALAGYASAAIDVSDGLLADLGHICRASQCAAEIDVDRLPLSAALTDQFETPRAVALALGGGDDYELCFTAADSADMAHLANCTCIGTVLEGSGVRLTANGKPVELDEVGYQHF